MAFRIRYPLFVLFASISSPLWADSVGIGMALAPSASLQLGGKTPVRFGSMALLQSQHDWPGGMGDKGWLFELAIRFASLSYDADAEARSGTYSSVSFGAGYFYPLGSGWRAQALLNLSPYSTIIVASSTTSQVNGNSVKYASLTRLSGGYGFQPKIGVERNISIFRWTFFSFFSSLSFVHHSYSNRSDDTIISDADLKVRSKQSGSTGAALSLMLLDLGLNFKF